LVLIYLLLLLACFPILVKAEKCLAPGAAIELKGMIVVKAFPGPPNYESIDNGDKSEIYWILTTGNLFCGNKYDPENEKIIQIPQRFESFQLILNREQYQNYLPIISAKVNVQRKLVSAFGGHHKTPMLLKVDNLKPFVNSNNTVQ
jgi:hypothetical protein